MKFLVQFAQRHESFWLPELDTLLELNGVDPGAAYDHDRAWGIVAKGHKVKSFTLSVRTRQSRRPVPIHNTLSSITYSITEYTTNSPKHTFIYYSIMDY